MRIQSPSEAKGGRLRTQPVPREGTKSRALYDYLQAHRGEVVFVTLNKPEGPYGKCLRDLTDYYGLDIRNLGYRKWVLAGEWFGATYRDYIADRMAVTDRGLE